VARVLAGHRAEKTCWSNGVSGYRSADLWGEWQRRRRGFGSSTTNGVAMDAYLHLLPVSLCVRDRIGHRRRSWRRPRSSGPRVVQRTSSVRG